MNITQFKSTRATFRFLFIFEFCITEENQSGKKINQSSQYLIFSLYDFSQLCKNEYAGIPPGASEKTLFDVHFSSSTAKGARMKVKIFANI